MKIKQQFWKIMIGVLLYSLLAHWKDARQGFLDGIHDSSQQNPVQKTNE